MEQPHSSSTSAGMPTPDSARGGVKVVYITGWGRSGSTLLGNILGHMDGCVPVGEICAVWEAGVLQNRMCGCGAAFYECAFWQGVMHAVERSAGGWQPQRWSDLAADQTRTRNAIRYFTRSARTPSADLREYLRITRILYAAVADASGCRTIIDTSKNPFYGGLLGRIPSLDTYFVHLIRDSRAAAYSWSMWKWQPDVPMEQVGLLKGSSLWNIWNASAELIMRANPRKSMRMRYEDFIRQPQAAVARILAMADAKSASTPFQDDRTVRLHPTHTVRGNPCRFETGLVNLVPDMRWQSAMPRVKRFTAGLLTAPLLIRYGYLSQPRPAAD